ncbi:MAG: class I SAM-dependent methyltransferase [Bacteroidota bacterium]
MATIPDIFLTFIDKLVGKGGPEKAEYTIFNQLLASATPDQYEAIRLRMKSVSGIETLQGLAFTKPYGYPGDFEMLEKIYSSHINPDPHYSNWDRFFQAQLAPEAVRNRKTYIKQQLSLLQPARVLVLMHGPANEVHEFLSENTNSEIKFDLLDSDPTTSQYARKKLKSFKEQITFIESSVFRARLNECYDLIWCAGMFDYLPEKQFIFLINKYFQILNSGGNLIIGNFSPANSTRQYMEIIGNWYLIHRTESELISLARGAISAKASFHVEKEPLGVNNFLFLKKD